MTTPGGELCRAGKRRKFDESDDFYRAIKTDLPRLVTEQGLPGVTTLIKYLQFIGDIRVDHGWAAADFYHWQLQLACSDGEHDMARQGHYNQRVVDKLRLKYPRSTVGGTPANMSQPTQGTKFCSYHGHHRKHTTDDCEAIRTDPSLKGKQHPEFVEE